MTPDAQAWCVVYVEKYCRRPLLPPRHWSEWSRSLPSERKLMRGVRRHLGLGAVPKSNDVVGNGRGSSPAVRRTGVGTGPGPSRN